MSSPGIIHSYPLYKLSAVVTSAIVFSARAIHDSPLLSLEPLMSPVFLWSGCFLSLRTLIYDLACANKCRDLMDTNPNMYRIFTIGVSLVHPSTIRIPSFCILSTVCQTTLEVPNRNPPQTEPTG